MMKIVEVRRIPKRPYAACDICLYSSKRVLAPNKLTIKPTGGVTHWLCDEHLAQFKKEVEAL